LVVGDGVPDDGVVGFVAPLSGAPGADFDSGVGEAVATVRSSRVVSAGTSVVSGLSGEVTSCPLADGVGQRDHVS
jgi:hypothetical protein